MAPGEQALVILDANHSRAHVEAELELYAPLVAARRLHRRVRRHHGELAGAPRSSPDWGWNNPLGAVDAFLSRHDEFVLEEPAFPFNEGKVRQRVTYWPKAFLRRVA